MSTYEICQLSEYRCVCNCYTKATELKYLFPHKMKHVCLSCLGTKTRSLYSHFSHAILQLAQIYIIYILIFYNIYNNIEFQSAPSPLTTNDL
jgi:hypothetical protein